MSLGIVNKLYFLLYINIIHGSKLLKYYEQMVH